MKCYKCGAFLYENDFCAECGADVATYKRIVKKSNELYNRGLEMARDRNLSGAIQCLQVSLKMYKANINARNLLGLVYVEIGEYAMGLAEWVISKSLQNENNMADHFLDALQNSRQDLNLMNSTIRKYNKAIGYIGQGNYDLAEIQLKKLLNDNPNLVKGHQLLALILIRKKKFAEARNALRKARKIDQGNATTIAYMAMVDEEIKEEESDLSPTELRNKRVSEKAAAADKTPLSGDDVIIPKSSYREYNPATMTVIQIIIGILIGAAIIFFIVVPNKTKSVRNEYTSQISELNSKITELEKQVSEAESRAEEAENQEPEQEDPSFSNLVDAQIAYSNEDYEAAYTAIAAVDESKLSEDQKTFYTDLKTEIMDEVTGTEMDEAIALYDDEKYDEAIEKFKTIYDMGAKSADLLYYLGRSYDNLEDKENTLTYLREYVSEYPDDANAEVAAQIINSWTADDN